MKTRYYALCLSIVLLLVSACTRPQQPPIQELSSINIGIAPYTQPTTSADLLAGILPEQVPAIDEGILAKLDLLLEDTLLSKAKRNFTPQENARLCQQSVKVEQAGNRRAALRYWSAVGRCMEVDYIIVPQIIDWREREGGSMGAARPARIIMDTFIIDVNNEVLISRSRYDETQASLTDNLLHTRKFFQRGGRWVEAQILAREGMEKAIKELGL